MESLKYVKHKEKNAETVVMQGVVPSTNQSSYTCTSETSSSTERMLPSKSGSVLCLLLRLGQAEMAALPAGGVCWLGIP